MPDPEVDVDAGGHRLPLGVSAVRALAQHVLRRERARRAKLSFAFVSPRTIARLNREHLGHSGPTDVIAFALRNPGGHLPLVGDIYIAPDVIRKHAREMRVNVREEFARVVIHGTLHALGHDHPEVDNREESPMWRRQERYLVAARAGGLW